jgi:hypothetical protein
MEGESGAEVIEDIKALWLIVIDLFIIIDMKINIF